MVELEIRPNVKRVESATVSIEDGREGSERNDNIFDTQNNPLTTRGTMERNWDSKTPPPAPKAKPDKLDPSEAPPAEYQIAQALYICFVVQLWRGTWYAWDYGLGFGWTGTMSSLVVGLFVISCFRSIHCLRRLVPVNPEVLVPGRFSIFAPAVSRGSIERFSVYDADESKLSIKRRIPRQVAHIVLVMACCSAYRGWWLLGDLAAGDEVYGSNDIAISFLVGAAGIALINLSPVAAYLMDDTAAGEGG